eukprot:CAMPEP_0172361746 /NCGR_PEP_ID=MMETSP1060-20121228/5533_1 /TAXON_ID=37318 /ORGANISM="Pseudo-nitzschia pungens, Strain cf. cingulata" /LENGTH=623 /DNA_ID=CAMNT_0013084109 /DNA_START=364 /DNA_END=2235 /DNA_ORIENTATION=+
MTTTTLDLILIKLVNSDHPMRVSELMRIIGGGTAKKEMNSLLYALQDRGLVKRTPENPPLWSATVEAASTVVIESSDVGNGSDDCTTLTQDEHKLVCILTEHGKEHGMSARSIAAFLGKSIAQTNKMLYGLERDTVVIQRASSCPPIWTIQSSGTGATEHKSSSSFDSSDGSSISSSSRKLKNEEKLNEVVEDFAPKRKIDVVDQRFSSEETLGKRIEAGLNDDRKSSAHNVETKQKIQESLSKQHILDEYGDEKIWAKKCGDAIWKKYRSLNAHAKNSDIIAGFILCTCKYPSKTSDLPRVVAIGSGTKFAAGDKLTCDGTVVHDSHAEVIARRSLIRWLYSQLQNAGGVESIVEQNDKGSDKAFGLPSRFYLWFYTSQTPCGDSAVYSRNLPNPTSCWEGNHNGSFRIKHEASQGSLTHGSVVQSLDGLRLGDRVIHHSCSDKLAKWSVLGIQGALLSRLVDPIYITGVIVGSVYSHGHICRAICCRSDYALKISSAELHTPFEVKHPRIRHAPLQVPRSEQTKKRGKLCYNWAEHDFSKIEVYNGTTGRREDGKESRICKKNLFESFIKLHASAAKKSYLENKAVALQYQSAKKLWKDSMRDLFGSWIKKPCEIEEFWLK